MKTLLNNNKYYMNLIIFIFLLSVISFFSINNIIASIFKHFSFFILLGISFYFFPFQILKIKYKDNRTVEIISKLIFAFSVTFIALYSIISVEPIEIYGKIISIVAGFFTFFLIFYKKQVEKDMLISHLILNFVLLGVLKMFYL
ncbi:hypothetical protein DI487_11250 [Flavobacterium sediminis]|uniref:Uncharacterized protein n=1 Tax=Flavobacterium sediminis TaxID=2201181 RepID=A0A2U8QW78_9FLAO|nr:hypothetical protein [Flavobacterium sediminis]AWM14373.1 hypothetical protein DI487_11250 [Flavobacterium sediminis]